MTEVEATKSILINEYGIGKEKIQTLLWGVDMLIFNQNYSNKVIKKPLTYIFVGDYLHELS